MLRIEGLRKTFRKGSLRELRAVWDLNLSLVAGEFVVLLGENGAGKTTLFNLISGHLLPDCGAILLGGCDITRVPAYRRSANIIRIYQSRDSGLPKAMTVEEVMRLSANCDRHGKRASVRLGELGNRLDSIRDGLSCVLHRQMWDLSGGEHQLVSLAVAILLSERAEVNSRVMLFDEHISQLDPVARDTVMETTARLIDEHSLTAIMATQDLEIAARYGSRQVLLRHGSVYTDLVKERRLTTADGLRELIASRRG